VRTVLSAVEATGVTPEHWEVRAPSLDDVFLALTGHVGQEYPARPAEVAA
jgi:ABC-2 type transport system ATP-binding protein